MDQNLLWQLVVLFGALDFVSILSLLFLGCAI